MATEYRNNIFMLENLPPPTTTGSPTRPIDRALRAKTATKRRRDEKGCAACRYARVSKADKQDTVAQVKAPHQAGCKRIFEPLVAAGPDLWSSCLRAAGQPVSRADKRSQYGAFSPKGLYQCQRPNQNQPAMVELKPATFFV
jgi:hypothetical protein